jgi:uncharacterized protein (TIRG00374 family)
VKQPIKKIAVQLVRWGIPLAIIAWLVRGAVSNDSFAQFRDSPKHWDLLALATVLCFIAVMVSIVRWYFLVRALNIELTIRDAFRLGFLGYLFSFITPGSVGGDLFKVVFLARERRGRKTEVAVTVIVDRLLGLYGLFIVGTVAILVTGIWRSESLGVRGACQVMFWCTGISTAALVFISLPGFGKGPIARRLHSLPRIGSFIERLTRANRMYHHHGWVVPLATGLSLVVQSLYPIAIWLIARGLLSHAPSLGDHFVIVPMGMATGALPLAPNGLGTFELLVEFLYEQMPDGTTAAASAGLIVALGYRLITVLIAIVGAGIYWASRREMSDMLHEAEREAAEQEDALSAHSAAANSSDSLASKTAASAAMAQSIG